MKQKLFTLLLAVAASVGTMFAWVDYERVQIGDLYYNLDATNQTAEVTYKSYNNYHDEYNYGWDITTANIPSSMEYKSVTYTVTSIGNGALGGCSSLTSVTIPSSVTSIGFYAFWGCRRLTSVTIPNSVTSIVGGAFYGCSGLTSVTIPNSVTYIGWEAFSGCSGLTSVTIPNSVTYIDNSAFMNCIGLTSVTIPNSVTYIGESAFEGCSKFTEIVFPSSVKTIGSNAFKNCNRLQIIHFAENIETINENAFANCPYLIEIYAKMELPPIIDASVFQDCGELSGIDCYVPESSLVFYKKTAVWKEFQLNPMQITYVTVQASATNGKVEGSGEYEAYSSVLLTVTPDEGYCFKQWSDGDASNPRSVYVTQDVVLNAICEPIQANSLPYLEPFTDNVGDFTINDVNVDGLSYVWKWASANYGMKASAYANNTNHPTESWLVSPPISLKHAKDIVLSFDHAVNKGTPDILRVKISTDMGTSWNDLTVPNWPAGTNWNFVSTNVSLDAYSEKIIQIAFVYKSTSSNCPTWEIKNFSVTGTVEQPTEVDTVLEELNNASFYKIFRNGQLFILRDGKTYTIQGIEVK